MGPEDGALLKMEMDALARRVACLPARFRDAVVLHHVQELSYEEAADALGQPVGTVKSNVHRGLKLLRGDNDDDSDH
jgi:RNA polymerase sigma-70 factor (ECF subfamily)